MGDDTDLPDSAALEPTLTPVLTLDVDVASPVEIGDTGAGRRRIIPITGGTVTGRLEGRILEAGADYQLFRTDGPTELVARYAFETDEGDRVYVENRGMRVAAPAVKARLRDGESVDPDDVYFATVPSFETAATDLGWLTDRVFVATGIRRPTGVRLAVYAVE